MNQPIQLTDEQRDQLLRATAELRAAFNTMAAAILPVAQAMTTQLRQAFKAAGLIDEHGQLVHQGGNTEDCPACARHMHNITYPHLCPGSAEHKELHP